MAVKQRKRPVSMVPRMRQPHQLIRFLRLHDVGVDAAERIFQVGGGGRGKMAKKDTQMEPLLRWVAKGGKSARPGAPAAIESMEREEPWVHTRSSSGSWVLPSSQP